MKKIIDRKVYDTKTATKIAEDSYSNVSDFRYYSEDLYKTKSGNWFLCGEGGAMSKYAERVGNAMGGGCNIIPLSTDEVIDWLERTDNTDILEEHFADQLEEA